MKRNSFRARHQTCDLVGCRLHDTLVYGFYVHTFLRRLCNWMKPIESTTRGLHLICTISME